MSIHFTNPVSGKEVNSDKELTYEEALEFLHCLTVPSSTLIMELPSGMGLDFEVQANGLLTVEFYDDDPSNASNASVTMKTAEQIIKRAFGDVSGKTKDIYADLILNWNF